MVLNSQKLEKLWLSHRPGRVHNRKAIFAFALFMRPMGPQMLVSSGQHRLPARCDSKHLHLAQQGLADAIQDYGAHTVRGGCAIRLGV